MPFIVPPQAEYIYYKIFHYNRYRISITVILKHTSAIDSGTPSPSTSLINECLVIAPFTGDSLLNASLSLFISESLTEIHAHIYK